MRNLLFLIMILIILSGFLFFDFGKDIAKLLSSVFFTLQKEAAGIAILYSGNYEIQAKPADLLTTSVYLQNLSSETVVLNQIVLGNKENNNFLNYFESNSYFIKYTDSKGITTTYSLIDSGKNSSNGYRIFNISPSITLPGNTTRQYQVSAKLKSTASFTYLTIELSNISGYGATTYTPITTRGSLSAGINIYKEIINGSLHLEGTKNQYNVGEQVILK